LQPIFGMALGTTVVAVLARARFEGGLALPTLLSIVSGICLVGFSATLASYHVSHAGWSAQDPYLTIGALRRIGCTDDELRAVLGGTATRLIEGKLPPSVSAPRSDGELTMPLDRARIANYLAAVTPLLWTGQPDAIGFLGLAAACCGDDPEVAEIRDLVLAVEAAWLEIAAVEPERRRTETRKLFRIVGLAQAMALYG